MRHICAVIFVLKIFQVLLLLCTSRVHFVNNSASLLKHLNYFTRCVCTKLTTSRTSSKRSYELKSFIFQQLNEKILITNYDHFVQIELIAVMGKQCPSAHNYRHSNKSEQLKSQVLCVKQH